MSEETYGNFRQRRLWICRHCDALERIVAGLGTNDGSLPPGDNPEVQARLPPDNTSDLINHIRLIRRALIRANDGGATNSLLGPF